MSLNLNTYNALPFYTDIDKWYDNRSTFAGIHSHIYMANGHIPFTQMAGNLSSLRLNVKVVTDRGTNIDDTYTSSIPSWDSNILSSGLSVYTITVQKQSDGRYHIWLSDGTDTWQGYHSTLGGIFIEQHRYFTDAQMVAGHVYFCVDGSTLYSECHITGLLGSASVVGATLTLVNCGTGVETDITSLFPVTADVIPAEYANDNMAHVLSFGGGNYLAYVVGSHYLKLKVDSVNYYSEPFQFIDNTENMILLVYRRSTPIVMTSDYFSFCKGATEMQMRMWLPSPLVTPPYEFSEEAQNLDGWEFVSKRVSFMKYHTECVCSPLFANAIRMMWHCNEVQMSYNGEIKNVDYVDAPQISWGESNHLCTAELEFRTDTIVQTNGNLRKNSSLGAGAYNNSFNVSFN